MVVFCFFFGVCSVMEVKRLIMLGFIGIGIITLWYLFFHLLPEREALCGVWRHILNSSSLVEHRTLPRGVRGRLTTCNSNNDRYSCFNQFGYCKQALASSATAHQYLLFSSSGLPTLNWRYWLLYILIQKYTLKQQAVPTFDNRKRELGPYEALSTIAITPYVTVEVMSWWKGHFSVNSPFFCFI